MKKPKAFKIIVVVLGLLLLLISFLALVCRESLRDYRQQVFVETALRGEVTRMRILLAVGANVDQPACETSLCPPPIVAAAFNEHGDAVQLLLDSGANVNGNMKRGQTALMVAAYHGHTDTVRLLLSRGADANADFEGDTALLWARQKGHADVEDLLVKAGATK